MKYPTCHMRHTGDDKYQPANPVEDLARHVVYTNTMRLPAMV